jgi:hypothetical protein
MKTWERICAQGPKLANLGKLVLLWITHAQTELTIDTLRRAVATSPETYRFDPKRMVPEALLLSVCCGLVSLDETTRIVRLIREFRPSCKENLSCQPNSLPRLYCSGRHSTLDPGRISCFPCHSGPCMHRPPGGLRDSELPAKCIKLGAKQQLQISMQPR